MWSENHIGHDVVTEDFCCLTLHVVSAGRVRVGTDSSLGVNSTLHNNIEIGEKNLIGVGSIIIKSTKPGSVFVP